MKKSSTSRWRLRPRRSEEHTSELQSRGQLVCRLLLEKKKSSYFATFRHQLTILSKTDALDEEKWLNMLGTFVKDWFRYESKNYLDKAGITTACLRIKSKWTAGGK